MQKVTKAVMERIRRPGGTIGQLEALAGLPADGPVAAGQDIEGICDEDWKEAQRRFQTIKPLLEDPSRTRAKVQQVAASEGVSTGTLYEWIRTYNESGQVSALIPRKRGRKRGHKGLDEVAETIIQTAIKEIYLTKQRQRPQDVVDHVAYLCRNAGIDAPHANTVRNRLKELRPAKVLMARGMGDKAHNLPDLVANGTREPMAFLWNGSLERISRLHSPALKCRILSGAIMSNLNQQLISVRYSVTSTNRSLEVFLELLAERNTVRVVLFATPSEPSGAFDHRSDGPTTNLPLVAALAQFEVPGVTSLNVVFDGLFLTAQRPPRYSEVRAMLDAAVASGKVYFAGERAPFTSALPPEVAAHTLLEVGGAPVLLTDETRPAYFSLLANMSEAAYQRL